MKKVEDNKSYGGGTVNSSTMGKNGDINKNNNNNGMSTPLQNQFPPKSDEYDVVFPGESCFYFLETEKGETAFGGYKPLPNGEKSPAELCNLYVRVWSNQSGEQKWSIPTRVCATTTIHHSLDLCCLLVFCSAHNFSFFATASAM